MLTFFLILLACVFTAGLIRAFLKSPVNFLEVLGQVFLIDLFCDLIFAIIEAALTGDVE